MNIEVHSFLKKLAMYDLTEESLYQNKGWLTTYSVALEARELLKKYNPQDTIDKSWMRTCDIVLKEVKRI